MWEGWTRVSSALTPVSVTLSWMWGPTRDWAVPYLLRSSVRLLIRGAQMVPAQIATPPNNHSNAASTHRSPRGHKSHNIILGWRVLTGLQPAHDSFRLFYFPSRRRFYLKSRLRNILDPRAGPCGQRSQAAEEMKLLKVVAALKHPRRSVRTAGPSYVMELSSIAVCPQQRKQAGEGSSGQTKLSTPGGERRAVRTDTTGMLIYVTLDPFAASVLHYLSVLIPHRP